MHQIVGQECVRCAKVIESIAEGDFCPACARPVHACCMPLEKSQLKGYCESCSNALDDEEAVQRRFEMLRGIGVERAYQDRLRIRESDTVKKAKSKSQLESLLAVGRLMAIILFAIAVGLGLYFGWQLRWLGGGH